MKTRTCADCLSTFTGNSALCITCCNKLDAEIWFRSVRLTSYREASTALAKYNSLPSSKAYRTLARLRLPF